MAAPKKKSLESAAKASTKGGSKITRGATATRKEVRRVTTHRQGHTK